MADASENPRLDENVFSMKLPSGIRHLDKPRSDGELTIGGLNTAHSDLDFIHLPLNKISYVLVCESAVPDLGRWQFLASRLQ
jgi:hypothetical protein